MPFNVTDKRIVNGINGHYHCDNHGLEIVTDYKSTHNHKSNGQRTNVTSSSSAHKKVAIEFSVKSDNTFSRYEMLYVFHSANNEACDYLTHWQHWSVRWWMRRQLWVVIGCARTEQSPPPQRNMWVGIWLSRSLPLSCKKCPLPNRNNHSWQASVIA
jgi:hypothetical protein